MTTKCPFLIVAVSCCLFAEINHSFAQTWTMTTAPITNWAAIASSADGSHLVAVAGVPDGGVLPGLVGPGTGIGQVYTSTNSGAMWAATRAPTDAWTSVASSADGSKLVAVTVNGGIYTSTNYGADWLAAGVPVANWYSVASSAAGAQLVAVSGDEFPVGPIYASTNSGLTWMLLEGHSDSIASSADGSKLVAAAWDEGAKTQASTNSGMTWQVSNDSFGVGWYALASSADATRIVAAALWTEYGNAGGGVFTTTNLGSTWTRTSTPISNWGAVACSADGTKLAAAVGGLFGSRENPGPIYTSIDSGATWTSNSVPIANWSSIASSSDGSKLVAVVYGGGIWVSQTLPAPRLNITVSNGNLLLSWIVPSMDFALQQNSNLTTATWTDVTNRSVLNLTNLENQVIVATPAAGGRSFRLKH